MDYSVKNIESTLELKTSEGFKMICINQILCIEAAGKFSIIFLDDNTSIVSYHLLKWFDKSLSYPDFFRCHNSFIVNCQHISSYCNKEIILKCKKRIPLSRNRIKSFKESYRSYVVSETRILKNNLSPSLQ